jgi:amino acid permease
MDKRTILILLKLIPVVSALLTYILILSSVQAGALTTVTVLLAFFGFVFFFIGRKYAKKDNSLKILGRLDLLSTLAIVLLYALAAVSFGL